MSGAKLIVLAGPTAVGKGTVAAWVRDHHPEITMSVSATTRAPRPGEVDGQHYHFVSAKEFDHLIDSDGLLEWATVHGVNRYGTPRKAVEDQLAAGNSVLLEIDLQGARQVKQHAPDAVMVFLAHPSWEELVSRLVGRGTENEAERERRLATARQELAAVAEFDVVITNTEVEKAGQELVDLFSSGSSVDAG